MARPDNFATTFDATGAGTNAGVNVDKAAPADTNKRHVVTAIQCSGDSAAVVTVESPAGTVKWQKRFNGAFTMSEAFIPPIKGAVGQAVRVKISASTAACEANMQGYTTP